ncbi:hypothetical protein D3C79_947960 [compost metagenome]
METSAAFLGSIFSKIAVLLALFITLKICTISSVVKFSRIGAALEAFIPAYSLARSFTCFT